jgi:hypothetical protein
MTEAEIRDLLPLWVRGELSPTDAAEVGRAVDASVDLAEEADALRRLLTARVEPPAELLGRITAAVDRAPGVGVPMGARAPREGGLPLGWLSAAATVMIALGGSWMLTRSADGVTPDLIDNGEAEVAWGAAPMVWPSDDGVVAGEAMLGELTEEQLERLLEEMRG